MAITRIQNVNDAAFSSGTPVTLTAFNATAGNTIVVFFGHEPGGVANGVTSVTDTAGNPYTVGTKADLGGGTIEANLAWSVNILGNAANVITINITAPGANAGWASAVEYSGITAFDVQSTGTGTDAQVTLPTNGASVTTTNDEALLFSGVRTNGASNPMSAAASWTKIYDNNDTHMVQERIVASSGPYSGGALLTNNASWAFCLAAFKGSQGITPPSMQKILNINGGVRTRPRVYKPGLGR
jgi:hypothetical protein